MQQTWEAICSPQMVCRILSEPLAHSALVQAVDIQQRMERKGLARDQVSDRRVRRGLENPASRGPERGIYLEKFQAEETLPLPELSLPLPPISGPTADHASKLWTPLHQMTVLDLTHPSA